MARVKLTKLIENAETMREAFNNFKNMKIEILNEIALINMGTYYIPIVARKEFVIFELRNKNQFLHPYGTNMGYMIDE